MLNDAPSYRLSPQQRAQWARCEQPAYFTITLTLRGQLDRQRLLNSMNQLASRYEILRTEVSLQPSHRDPSQSVQPYVPLEKLPDELGPEDSPFTLALRNASNQSMLTLRVSAWCADAWTLRSILDKLSAAYRLGRLPETPVTVQYPDLAEAFNILLQDEDGRHYWESRDTRANGSAELSRWRSRLSHDGTELRAAVFDMKPANSAGHDEGQNRESDTRSFALFVLFLYRMTRSRSVLVAYRDAGCALLGELDLIGPTARLLPLSFEIGGSRSCTALMKDIESETQTALMHAVHFDCVRASRSHIAPLFRFDACCPVPVTFADFKVLTFECQEPDDDVGVYVSITGSQVEPRLELRARGMDAAQFAECELNLRRWLAFCRETPDRPVDAFEWFPLDATFVPFESEREASRAAIDMPNVLQEWARRTPDREAVHDAKGSLSYAQLDAAVRAASRAFLNRGIGPRDVVALQLRRSRAWVTLWLACWTIGAVAMPVSAREPVVRLARMCARANARLLVSETAAATADAALPPVIGLAEFEGEADTLAFARSPLAVETAYILFTSGSTGEPKAAAISHGALSCYLGWARAAYAGAAKGGTIVCSELMFDFTQTSLWLPLLAGETIRFAPEDLKLDVLCRMLASGPELSFIKLTPAHLQGICALESAGEVTAHWPQHVVIGGAALTGAMLPPSLRRSGAMVHNEYGPTEATVGCSVYSARADELPQRDVPIGVACPGNLFFVLDAYMNPVMPGETGELFISGEQLAQGYLNDSRETAARFVPHPYSPRPGTRLYRSGDLVERMSATGHIFRGRADDMVKRNGIRIEPGEISAHMLLHPAVSCCYTLTLQELEQAEPEIVCAAVCGDETADALMAWLAAHLPHFMLPNRVVTIDRLPLTRHGKVNASELRNRLTQRETASQEFSSGAEALLGAIWRNVLRTPIGPRSNFFVEGGDSIRAITVAVEARRKGLRLSVEDLFKHPTLCDLAAAAVAPRDVATYEPAQEPAALVRQGYPPGVEDEFPISYLQLGMIFQNQAYKRDGRYHDIFSYLLELEFDASCLREAARRLVARHPSLRTTFDLASADEPLQRVWYFGADVLDVQDISRVTAAEQERIVRRWIDDERRRGFDVATLPLLRFQVHRLGPRRVRFTTSFHHAIMDGWSDQQIHSELFAEYRDLLCKRDVPVKPPTYSYRHFVAAEQVALHASETRRFWIGVLQDITVNALSPAKVPTLSAPPLHADAYTSFVVGISERAQQRLKELGRKAGEPLSVLLLAAHVIALRLLTGQRDILTCTVVNCRLDEESAARAVGLYINTVPVRARVERGATWRQLIRELSRSQQTAFEYRRFPFAALQREMGVEVLSQSLFYFTSFHNRIPPTEDLIVLDKSAHEITSFPLTASFNLEPASGQLGCRLTFDARVFPAGRMRLIESLYAAALESLAAGIDRPCPQSDILHRNLRSAVCAESMTADGTNVLALFHEQARRMGDAPAVVASDGSVTYRELARWSDAVSEKLMARGIGAEAVVALLLPRSAALVAAMLGVLKAAASFTLLDPDLPPTQLRHMLGDAQLVIRDAIYGGGIQLSPTVAVIDSHELGRNSLEHIVHATARHNQAAYRVYTSGSTGTPKCVVVEHGGLANVLQHFRTELRLQQTDRVLLTSAITFDISLVELLLPLIGGATLIMVDRKDVIDPSVLARAIDTSGATVVQATPSQWTMLRAAGWEGSRRIKALSGGEALPSHLAGWLVGACAEAWNLYGPSETTIWSTSKRLTAAEATLGKPISGTRCYVLDETLDELPLGSVGDLFIGGPGVSRGYDRAPGATAAAFLPDPFAGAPGARMYRTGDRALIDEHAELVFLGRSDQQIKIAGHRLELEEVEANLLAHPAVAAATVTELPSSELGLIAYLIAAGGLSREAFPAVPSPIQLRDFLSQRIPPYAVPSRYVWVSYFPRTRNGKLDRVGLRRLGLAKSEITSGNVEPISGIERLLQQLWSRVLQVEPMSTDVGFVELGGYSLSAIKIVAQLRHLLDIDVSVSAVFTAPTIGQFADHLLHTYPEADIEAKADVLLSIL
jgi:amino acid adenylation domain-containing protein